MLPDEQQIRDNIACVWDRIENAASSVGRNPADIEVIAVTKQKSAAVIKSLYEIGINKIGESYLKEALLKQQLLSDYKIEWHMIGMIQRGKSEKVVANFDQIHSVDRLDIALEINKRALQIGIKIPVFLEFNVSGEATKHGWKAFKEDLWPRVIPEIELICELNAIQIRGLMTMAPYSNNPENARPYFVRLRKLLEFLDKRFPQARFEGLSMGMSGDFEPAIQEGATTLRIGSALVGSR